MRKVNKNNKLIFVIYTQLFIIICLLFFGGVIIKKQDETLKLHADKIKFLDQAQNFSMLTSNGQNAEGVRMWQKLEDAGQIDKLFKRGK